MTRDLSHDEAFAALDAVALDALDAADRDAVLAHVERCEACRAELESLRETAAYVAFGAPAATASPSAIRARIRANLLARAGASVAVDAPARRTMATPTSAPTSSPLLFPPKTDPTSQYSTDPRDVVPASMRYARTLAIAASILLVASLGVLGWSLNERRMLTNELTAQVGQSQHLLHSDDSLAAIIAVRDSLLGGLTGRDVSVMTLTSSATREPFARMFWDRARNTWTLIAHNMPALKAGRTYQLWLVTPTAKISAGTFDPHNGEAVVRATYALSATLQALVVTEEPAGGVPQPTGGAVVAVNVGH